MKKVIGIVVLVFIVLLIVSLMFITQYSGVIRSSTTPSSTSSSTGLTNTSTKLAVYDIIPIGFNIVDEIVYLRFRIIGEVDLREKMEINGVYGDWIGFIEFIVPNNVKTWVFTPPDYYTGRNTFKYILGTVDYDAPIYDLRGGSPSTTHPQSPLNGTYIVRILLNGPYSEERGEYTKVLLMEKKFTYMFNVSINLHTLNWSSWDQDINITIINEGEVPVFFKGGAVLVHGVNTVIGWFTIEDPYIPVDVNQSKNIVVKLVFLDDYKSSYEGETRDVDLLFEFISISYINITFKI
ncbi:MAG: hypothetical protein QXP40_01420 [Desulfurococcaceae archaeon]